MDNELAAEVIARYVAPFKYSQQWDKLDAGQRHKLMEEATFLVKVLTSILYPPPLIVEELQNDTDQSGYFPGLHKAMEALELLREKAQYKNDSHRPPAPEQFINGISRSIEAIDEEIGTRRNKMEGK